MATDTTALATAIAAMRAAVAAGDVANAPRQLSQAALNEVRATVFAEADAGRALLAALEGVPERLAALEGEEGTLDLEDALAVLAGEGPG